MPRFPHLDDPTFPNLGNVDVYKYRNEFDYSRYDGAQMHIMLCSVPWDMGEAHIGNRTISGIGNVVWFETEAKRDAWFDAIPDNECLRFDTKYKELHRDNEIMLPVPFDVACQYNYLVVEYEPFASQDSLVQYETRTGLDRWFWFVREVEFVSPNTTRVHLLNDAFQTWMYRIHIGGMVLERGHAPLFAIDANTYLANPLENNAGLLAEDVNYGGEPVQVKTVNAHVFNSNTWACFACTSNANSTVWGTKTDEDWKTPASAAYFVNGAPSYRIFAMAVSDLNTFLTEIESNYPQFKQTVKGIFFAPRELITTGATFTFAGVTCRWVSTSNVTIDIYNAFAKSQFGYPSEYADLAKLYTWPYACFEITDENGNSELVKVEETSGSLSISAAMSLAYPAIKIQAHMLGVGQGPRTLLQFKNVTDHSLTIGGRWYKTLHEWDVPVFGVIQSAEKYNDFVEYFDRKQAAVAYNNTYDSSTALAETAKDNSNAEALTGYENAVDAANVSRANMIRTAWVGRDNAKVQTDANTLITTGRNNAAYGTGTGAHNELSKTANNAYTAQANNFINNTTNAQIDATLQSAAVSASAGVLTSGVNSVGDAMSGNPVGAVTGFIGGVINAGAAVGQAVIASNLTATQATYSTQQNEQKRVTSNNYTDDVAHLDTSLATTETTAKNSAINATAKNAADGQIGNANDSRNLVTGGAGHTVDPDTGGETATTLVGTAPRTRATTEANTTRTYDTAMANAGRAKDTSQKAVSNRLKQKALNAPLEFGEFANTGQATTKPLALIVNTITQTVSAIAQTGDEFLRYGYYYNRQWDFNGDWNIGPYFTYWKLADFWVKGLNVPDMYVDKLRFFLYGGVTVWRRPEDIGNVSIYDNI